MKNLFLVLALVASSIAFAKPIAAPGTDYREHLVCQPEYFNGGVQIIRELSVNLLYITAKHESTETRYYSVIFKDNFLPNGDSEILAKNSSVGNFGKYTIEFKKVSNIQSGQFEFGSFVATIKSGNQVYTQKLVCD